MELVQQNVLTKAALAPSELKLTIVALEKNPKSYSAWHHRGWVVTFCDVSLQSEIELCNLYLSKDLRNFHCWDYRRSLVKKSEGSITSAAELDYTTKKIVEDFSNFSAWHYRSKLLPLHSDMKAILEKDFDCIQQAIYTEPEDQSPWLYHLWLMNQSRSILEPSEFNARLQTEEKCIRELLDMEPNCRLAQLALVRLLKMKQEFADKMNEFNNTNSEKTVSDRKEHIQEIIERYQSMAALDSMRSGFYEDQIKACREMLNSTC